MIDYFYPTCLVLLIGRILIDFVNIPGRPLVTNQRGVSIDNII